MSYSSLPEFKFFGKVPSDIVDERESTAQKLLDAACDEMADYFRTAGIDLPIPVASVSTKMKQVESAIAAYHLMGDVGFDPTSKSDEIYLFNYQLAIKWLEKVADKKIIPIPVNTSGNLEDADPDTQSDPAAVYTETARGWE